MVRARRSCWVNPCSGRASAPSMPTARRAAPVARDGAGARHPPRLASELRQVFSRCPPPWAVSACQLDVVAQRVQRRSDMVWRALQDQAPGRRLAGLFESLPREPRLPSPASPEMMTNWPRPARAAARLSPSRAISASRPMKPEAPASGAQGVEPARRARPAMNLLGPHRQVETLPRTRRGRRNRRRRRSAGGSRRRRRPCSAPRSPGGARRGSALPRPRSRP